MFRHYLIWKEHKNGRKYKGFLGEANYYLDLSIENVELAIFFVVLAILGFLFVIIRGVWK